jgi:hypothetical protein
MSLKGDLPVTPEPLETLRGGLPEGNKSDHDVGLPHPIHN